MLLTLAHIHIRIARFGMYVNGWMLIMYFIYTFFSLALFFHSLECLHFSIAFHWFDFFFCWLCENNGMYMYDWRKKVVFHLQYFFSASPLWGRLVSNDFLITDPFSWKWEWNEYFIINGNAICMKCECFDWIEWNKRTRSLSFICSLYLYNEQVNGIDGFVKIKCHNRTMPRSVFRKKVNRK